MTHSDIRSAEALGQAMRDSWDFDDDDLPDYTATRPFFEAGYVFLSWGATRAVFEDGATHIIKVPMRDRGLEANHYEAEAYEGHEAGRHDLFPAPVAPCELVDVLGIEVLRMVRVKTLREVPAQDELPAWIACIDNEQAGYLPDGRLVAYDL